MPHLLLERLTIPENPFRIHQHRTWILPADVLINIFLPSFKPRPCRSSRRNVLGLLVTINAPSTKVWFISTPRAEVKNLTILLINSLTARSKITHEYRSKDTALIKACIRPPSKLAFSIDFLDPFMALQFSYNIHVLLVMRKT